jgi:hypothetical protein
MEKYGRARQATDDNILRRMRTACWVTKATETHSEYVTFTTSSRQRFQENLSVHHRRQR